MFTLLISVLFVICIIFWLAGIAGLLANSDRRKPTEWLTYALIILVPPYPIIWLIADILKQYFRITRKTKQAMLDKH